MDVDIQTTCRYVSQCSGLRLFDATEKEGRYANLTSMGRNEEQDLV